MSWVLTFTGREYYPSNPSQDDIDILDIAHSLSMQCRYNGHCRKFYSVAEHSVHIANWLYPRYGAEYAFCGLMHDATEAYVADVPGPIKSSLIGYSDMEYLNWLAISEKFGLPSILPNEVKEADKRILADEFSSLMKRQISNLEPLGVDIKCLSPEFAFKEFMSIFRSLCSDQQP